jgi:hypothetical protein
MVGVAVAALDFAAIRAMYGFLKGELLMLGELRDDRWVPFASVQGHHS